MRHVEQLAERGQSGRRHAEVFQRQQRGVVTQQTQHDAFAGGDGNRAHADVDLAFADHHARGAVLRQTFFGDVEPRHDFQPRGQRGFKRLGQIGLLAQDTVDARAQTQAVRKGFDVDVGGVFLQRLQQDRVDQTRHRRVIGRTQQIAVERARAGCGIRGVGLASRGTRGVRLFEVDRVDRRTNHLFGGDHRMRIGGQQQGGVLQRVDIGRVLHQQAQAFVQPDRQHVALARVIDRKIVENIRAQGVRRQSFDEAAAEMGRDLAQHLGRRHGGESFRRDRALCDKMFGGVHGRFLRA